MAKKQKTIAQLKKEADRVHSIYIRMRDADDTGEAECITCGVKKHWKDLQCGHFVSRKVNLLRYDELNTSAQCVGCNMFKAGEQYAYSKALDLKFGPGKAEELWAQRFDTHKFTRQELESIIEDRKTQIKWMEDASH